MLTPFSSLKGRGRSAADAREQCCQYSNIVGRMLLYPQSISQHPVGKLDWMADFRALLSRWFAEHPDKTQAGLARHLGGIDRSIVHRMVHGPRQFKEGEMDKIAEYFGVQRHGFAEEAAGYLAADDQTLLAPIYEATSVRDGWRINRQARPVDTRRRPLSAANGARVFGFYAPDSRCWPRFKTGEIIWIDPARPARPGDDAIFIERKSASGPESVRLGELKSANKAGYAVIQYDDRREHRLTTTSWDALLALSRE